MVEIVYGLELNVLRAVAEGLKLPPRAAAGVERPYATYDNVRTALRSWSYSDSYIYSILRNLGKKRLIWISHYYCGSGGYPNDPVREWRYT
ncbi:MAG: hypothetical protein HYY64_01970 [Candidatus Rokubacteria bacterium]|nr:hypothetical protein [Candidatus Rokubacteria bacterium]